MKRNTKNIQVCDIVEYGLDSFGEKSQTYRVTHFLRKEYQNEYSRKHPIKDRFLAEFLLEEKSSIKAYRKKQGLPWSRRYRLIYCRPEEATHVSLVGIGSAIALISKCKKIGVVKWEEASIKRERDWAIADFWLKNDFRHDWIWE